MKIINKIATKAAGSTMAKTPVPTIAFLGDSVTQGCFETFRSLENCADTVYEQGCVYHTYLKQMLAHIYPKAQITIVNAGICGDNSGGGLARLDRDVLPHHPDLTVVCFGLNDSNWGMEGVQTYKNNLREIFRRLLEAGGEVIFMTPNMMNTRLSFLIKDEMFIDFAKNTMSKQNDGVMDAYMDAAREAAGEFGIPVCDVYAKWKRMASYGTDVTALLSNYINHPTRQMHYLFAHSLLETMFEAE